ncbi:MAG: murein biosynthesis integral membrane protein MurJ [Anaerolineae bacterium]|nr:murein biosynthesis integral membrane protein MurJ [Anaerolineae bacterium]
MAPSTGAPSIRAHVARSTFIVMTAFAAAKGISLIQTWIIARTFGISPEYDAFVAANRLPEIIFNLIAGGAIAFAFIPVFTGLLARNETKQAWKTASHVANTIFLLTLIASGITFLLSDWLVSSLIAPGFPPEIQALTTGLMRVLLISTLIFSISGIVMGILQSHNRFLLPALAPIMYDLGILFGVLFLIEPFGIYGLAIGAVLGAALHLLVQIPGLFQVRARWFAEFGWRDANLRQVIVLMIPRMADLGLISLSAIITTNILSRLGPGATSAYDWGWRLMQIPETLIGTAMGTVIFPTLAAFSSLGDIAGKRTAFSGSVRFILIGTIPSAIFLIVAGKPLLSLLQGGAFDDMAVDLVYSTLQFFALGIVVHSVLEVVARSFYADKDTLTPLWVAFGGAVVNIGIALLFTGVLTGTASPDQVGMLALANTLGVTFEVVLLSYMLRRRWHGLDESHIGKTALKALIASLIMGAVIFALDGIWVTLGLTGRGTLWTVILLGVTLAVSGLVFLVAAWLLRIEEVKSFFVQGLRRLRPARREAPAGTPA